MLCDKHVFKDRHALPEADILEGARDAALGYLVRRRVDNTLPRVELGVFPGVFLLHFALGRAADYHIALKGDDAVRRLVHAGDAVEGRGLARAVRSDEGAYLPLLDGEV